MMSFIIPSLCLTIALIFLNTVSGDNFSMNYNESSTIFSTPMAFFTPHCSNNTNAYFCEDVDNYPEEEIAFAMTHYPKKCKLQSDDTPIYHGVVSPFNMVSFSEETLCQEKTVFINPKAAVNNEGNWVFIVNVPEYTQVIQTEICVTEGVKCKYLDGVLPYGFTSKCHQKYAYLRLLVYQPDNSYTYVDKFRFPSCCACYVNHPVGIPESEQRHLE